ncbi:MAG: hypothetical protein HFG64_07485 [Lachnospiraceae bacterium]|nr:hypothetical protein [Lachnospiraceae bacterium]
MNNQLRTQETEKNILLRAGMEPEEIRMLADSDLTLNVQLINDFAFKKVFRNKKALTGLLSALLEIPVEEIVDLPEATRFYSIIRLMDVKTKLIYSDKMSLRVLYLNRLDQASKKERRTQVYRWAKLITAKDWEDLRRIAMEDEYKAEAVKEMERINADRELRYEYLSQEIARLDENTRRAEEHRNREKARQEGREEERQLQLRKAEVSAQKLHKRGISIEEIAEILDIPADQVVHWV